MLKAHHRRGDRDAAPALSIINQSAPLPLAARRVRPPAGSPRQTAAISVKVVTGVRMRNDRKAAPATISSVGVPSSTLIVAVRCRRERSVQTLQTAYAPCMMNVGLRQCFIPVRI
jgi:hypothetical protein